MRATRAVRRGALEIALKEQPDDPDALFALAQVSLQQQRPVEAAALLARAEKVAPPRAELSCWSRRWPPSWSFIRIPQLPTTGI